METKELGFETICKLFPILQPEPYEGDVLKHGTHDQRSHGSWAHGGADNSVRNFEKAVNDAYGTDEESFSIYHTGDQSVSSLGEYLARGHTVNDNIRNDGADPSHLYIDGGTVKGLDNAIEMAPPIPNQTVWRTASADAILALKKNGVYQDKGFTSTTAVDITNPDNENLLFTLLEISSGTKAIMQIDTGSSGKGLYIPKMFPNQPIAEKENEFLMPRNTKMKYLGPDYRFNAEGDGLLEVHKFKVVS